MGGYGSGGHNRKKSSIGYFPKIDSFWFNRIIPIIRENNVKQNTQKIEWNNGAKINVIIYKNNIEVSYSYQATDYDEWKNVKENIYFSETSNNYGGSRIYLVCPHCHNRFRFLYIRSGYFRCRRCNKLNYPTSRHGKDDIPSLKMENLLKRKFKIDTKEMSFMNMSDYIPYKPKGMHWNTYYKWLEKLEEAQDEYNSMVIKKCYSLGLRCL